MNWKGFLIRLGLVIVAFPAFWALIFLVPDMSHLAFNVLVVLATVMGSFEVVALFRSRRIPTSTILAPVLAATFPIGTYLGMTGILSAGWLGIWMPAAVGILLVRAVFFQERQKLSAVLAFASSSLFTFFYPGFFLSWIVRFSGLPDPSLTILLFLCLVFGNDMSAYFAGSLWGASSRLNLAVSPTKSVVGFAAGLLGSLIVIVAFHFAVSDYPRFGIGLKIALALCTGVLVILGDLLESGLKRSAGVKDSGVLIPGRGGILDSVDSMTLAAPLFFYFILLASG